MKVSHQNILSKKPALIGKKTCYVQASNCIAPQHQAAKTKQLQNINQNLMNKALTYDTAMQTYASYGEL